MTPTDQPELPPHIARSLIGFVEAARAALGPDLRSIVLFGSGAEGRLRATSDLNLILVLREFRPEAVDGLREPLRTAQAAARVETMFLLEGEVRAAVEAFAVKFADVLRRHVVLLGDDPFTGVSLPRAAEVARLRQVLLNLTLRLRQQYMLRSLREEQAALAVADAAGPLRSFAAALLELAGRPAPSPKEALATVVAQLPGSGWNDS